MKQDEPKNAEKYQRMPEVPLFWDWKELAILITVNKKTHGGS